jgi:hypothetical protein
MMRIGLVLCAALAGMAAAQDLTGIWHGQDGGTYQMTQRGNELWWYGESADGGKSWQNVFHGVAVAPGAFNGTWSDLPSGASRSGGTLALKWTGDRLIATSRTGGFGGAEWVRAKQQIAVSRMVIPSGNLRKGIATLTPSPGTRTVESYTVGLPELWAHQYVGVLETVIRKLAGDDGWSQYLTLETEQLKVTTDSARVQKRMEFINLLLEGS